MYVLASTISTISNPQLTRSQTQNALPFSNHLSKISAGRRIPLHATLASATFCILFGLIYIASTTAFSSVVNMATLLQNLAYTVPQGILVAQRRRGHLAADRELRLEWGRERGMLGYAVNGFAVVWLVFSGVLFCFPNRVPTTAGSMN
jgi:choline transport protein